MTEKVCVVIATLNRRSILENGLGALRAQTFPVHRFLVVDNDSTDGTRQWLETQGDIQIITQSNSGSAGGFHTGILAALQTDCDWLWLMDDDVLPASDALQELVRAIHARPEARVFNSLCLGVRDQTRPCAGALHIRTEPNDFLRGESLYSVSQIRARADTEGMLDSAGGNCIWARWSIVLSSKKSVPRWRGSLPAATRSNMLSV